MATFDERLAALEQTSVTRTELAEAINKLEWQQARALRDRNHETTITLGVLSDDVRLLKEGVSSIKVRVNEGFPDLNQELYSIDEKFTKRFTSVDQQLENIRQQNATLTTKVNSLETRFDALEAKVDGLATLLTQILTRLHEKS